MNSPTFEMSPRYGKELSLRCIFRPSGQLFLSSGSLNKNKLKRLIIMDHSRDRHTTDRRADRGKRLTVPLSKFGERGKRLVIEIRRF